MTQPSWSSQSIAPQNSALTGAEARELCRSFFLETLSSLRVAPRLREIMTLRESTLRIGTDSYSVSSSRAICVVSFGKAAIEMADAATEILQGIAIRGVVVAPGSGPTNTLPYSRDSDLRPSTQLQYFHAGHPYPDERSAAAADAVLDLLADLKRDDIVLFLISGGGSALIERPLDPSISMDDMRRFHEVLVTCGANIQEINALRKHFSAVKGGRLALRAHPAKQITLYVSDVPEQFPSAVASGPTMPDESTVEECQRIVARYDLLELFPSSIRALLASGKIAKTPKPGDACFSQSRYHCLLSNRTGVEKLLELARVKGMMADTDTSCDDWQFERAADYLLGRLEALRREYPARPVLLVSGGELSSPVAAGSIGVGGRNQAFVLSCVPKIAGKPLVVLSAGTDGIDGNSPACGAIADGESAWRAARMDLDPREFLSQNDSYRLFDKLGDAIVTGPTGTNVRDLRMLLAYGSDV